MAKDFLGKELFVGDKVAFFQINYRNFLIGTITKINEKKVTIEHEKTNICRTKTMQFHEQVIKIEEDDKYRKAIEKINEQIESLVTDDPMELEVTIDIVRNMTEEALGLEITKNIGGYL